MKRPREIAVNLPDVPVGKTPLATRLMTHAESMQSEGWYTTANVLAEAADAVVETPDGLGPSAAALVREFAAAMAVKLREAEKKYGYRDNWLTDDWETECRQHLRQHLDKGDPRDVAIYAAFMWKRGWSTRGPTLLPPIGSDRVQFEAREIGVTLMDDSEREPPALPSGKTFLMD